MNAQPTIDLVLRAGLVSLMLFSAAVVLHDHARSLAARLAAALAVGVAAYAVQSVPDFGATLVWWHVPVAALSTGNAVVFWLFSRALFDDEFRWRAHHGALWLAMAAAGVLACFASAQIGLGITVANLAFAGMAVVQTLASWRADLVEKRRRLRVFVVGAGAFYTVLNVVMRLAQGGHAGGLVDIAALSAVAAAVAWHLVRSSGAQLLEPAAARRALPVAHPETSPETGPEADIEGRPTELPDTALIAALEHLMTAGHAYRQDGLTIGALALQLCVPEYKLRRAINQGLGYRNFNAFLNRYRIDEVKAALADPAQAPVPVLTLALDAGFQSIGPFNRAFKAETGLTPTEFRRTAAA